MESNKVHSSKYCMHVHFHFKRLITVTIQMELSYLLHLQYLMDVVSSYFADFVFRKRPFFEVSIFTFDTEVPFIYFTRTQEQFKYFSSSDLQSVLS